MTLHECAEYIRMKESTLYKKVFYGNIPYRKHGGRVVFHRDEIDAWSLNQKKSESHKKLERCELSRYQEARQRLLQHRKKQASSWQSSSEEEETGQ